MILISANPTNPKRFTGRKASTATGRKVKKGVSPMARKYRSPAQKAATRKMHAANRSRRKTHHNPSSHRKVTRRRRTTHRNPVSYHRRRRTHRNPSLLGGSGVLGELLSAKGAVMVAAAFAAPVATSWLQQQIMPTATGWTKVAVQVGLVAAGAYAIDKFLKQRNAAIAFGVTGLASVGVLVKDIVTGVVQGLSADEADMVANRPDLIQRAAAGQLGGAYGPMLAGNYGPMLADQTGFNPAFPNMGR